MQVKPHLKSFLRRQKQFKREKEHQQYRLHNDVPWIESPLLGAEGAESDELVFHQRHEANTLELFFDLFFVANLATFTAYHTITDGRAVLAYIGFFAVLWSTWFQITLHDVRFARDCKLERLCKLGQMIVFVSFALVGSKFWIPTNLRESVETNDNKNFRILCYTLVVSRIQLVIQYAVVLVFTVRKGGYERLVLPLCLNTLVYATSTIVFGAMSAAFLIGADVSVGIVSVWWIVMCLEALSTIVISSFWRMLSFKATHLVERMGLLTLIVIGEGAIGVTKTVSKLMGKSDTLEAVAVGQVLSIIVLLILLWALYFDNQPHGHYGTIKQQIWSLLHFPFHLAIVGVVEGAQQIAQARLLIYSMAKLTSALHAYCLDDHLDGAALGAKLNATMAYYQLDRKLETAPVLDAYIIPQINLLASALHQGVCSEANTTALQQQQQQRADHDDGGSSVPEAFDKLLSTVLTALISSMGMKVDPKKLATTEPRAIAWNSFETVYLYWWGSLGVTLLCYMAFLYIVRKHKADVSDYCGQATRGAMMVLCFSAWAALRDRALLHAILGKPVLLPTAVCILGLINFSDKLIRQLANRRILKKDRPVSSVAHMDMLAARGGGRGGRGGGGGGGGGGGHHGRGGGGGGKYDKLPDDPEKDAEIRGLQLKRQPPLEILEMDQQLTLLSSRTAYSRLDYAEDGAAAGPLKPRDALSQARK